ncbi:flippase [Bifidobacterium jacchi]|uniref:Flippase n=1 Tax=Bifidobacterium jacchi TaxID=2490545 RepID=A0A5N5REE7_9BIFI|nr:flippase [Bifidobacterium jacchi]KAB5604857.1 flippase [Bifidobacterium jacchi]
MNMILTSSSFIFPLITVPYVSRVLNPAGIGAVAFAQSIISYFSLAALLGIQMYGVRACAQVRDDKVKLSQTVEELILILVLSTSMVFVAYLCTLFFVPRFTADRPLYLMFSLALWLASFGVEWFYQAIEQYTYITVRSIIVKIIGLALMFAFVHETSDYRIYGCIIIFTGYGSNILNMIRLRSLVTFVPFSQLNIRRHFKPMRFFLISSISSGMYAQADMVMLGFLSHNDVVGIYQLVAKVKNILVSAVNSVVNVMLPRLSYYAKNSKTEYKSLMLKNIEFVLLFACAGIAIATLCPEAIINIIAGDQYRDAAIPLLCILPALLLVSLNTVLSQYLISSGKERQYAIINFVGLIFSLIYSCLLIPPLGAVGAALSCTLSELTALIVRFLCAHDFIVSIIKNNKLYHAPVATITSYLIIEIVHIFWWPRSSFLQITIVGMLFTLLYLIVLFLMHDETIVNIATSFQHRVLRKE